MDGNQKQTLQLIGEEHFIDSKKLLASDFRQIVKRRALNALSHAGKMEKDNEVVVGFSENLTDWQGNDEVSRKNNEQIIEWVNEKIHKKNNLLPISFLYDAVDRSKAICRISTSTSWGTGTLIGDGLILTNNHVLESKSVAEDSVAEFFYEQGRQKVIVDILPDKLFITNKSLDFTIVGCETRGIEEVPPVSLSRNPATVSRYDRVNIIQHPRGRKKEVALHDNKVQYVYDRTIQYHTDTDPGTSGATVYNNEWEVVALHHAGQYIQGDATKGALNQGIRISAIVDYLIRRQHTSNESDAISTVLANIEDTSPMLGFFDLAGLFPLGDTNLEVEVPDYTGNRRFADIGFWNIRHFNNEVSQTRISKVADLVGKLSMDVLGLTEVQDKALDGVVKRLQQKGINMDYVYYDARMGDGEDEDTTQDLAVLYDIETTKVEKLDSVYTTYERLLSRKTRRGSKAWAGGRLPLFVKCSVREDEGDTEFIMIVAHLKARFGFDNEERRRLAASILAIITEKLRAEYDLPVILGGDLNELIDSGVLDDLTDSPDLFALTTDDASNDAISYVGRRHRSLIDHIIVSNDAQLGQIQNDDNAIIRFDKSIRDYVRDYSDHAPVVMRLVYNQTDEPTDITRSLPSGSNCCAPQINPVNNADRALARADANVTAFMASNLNYYNPEKDEKDREVYYEGINLEGGDGDQLYNRLGLLLKDTHVRPYSYRRAKGQFLYPLIDLKANGQLNSIYSDKAFEVEEIIRADLETELRHAKYLEERSRFESFTSEQQRLMVIEELEAQAPYNCEHVVCQSWFGRSEPMKGDLHHLFTCEPRCNSSRSNHPYKDFSDYDPELNDLEAIIADCGKSAESRFEPENHKGIVARATLYFLVRYPGEISAYTADDIDLLRRWDEEFPVNREDDLYELHRNQTIHEVQGNRNPFIDFDGLSARVNFNI
ncbi:MAG: hypothetical protein HEP71_15080 [Roseivirga sp.]|nr:hypothetical protein [Roseivirga sp.]